MNNTSVLYGAQYASGDLYRQTTSIYYENRRCQAWMKASIVLSNSLDHTSCVCRRCICTRSGHVLCSIFAFTIQQSWVVRFDGPLKMPCNVNICQCACMILVQQPLPMQTREQTGNIKTAILVWLCTSLWQWRSTCVEWMLFTIGCATKAQSKYGFGHWLLTNQSTVNHSWSWKICTLSKMNTLSQARQGLKTRKHWSNRKKSDHTSFPYSCPVHTWCVNGLYTPISV